MLSFTQQRKPPGGFSTENIRGFGHKCGSKRRFRTQMLRIRKVSTESARLRRSRLEFSSFLRDRRRSSIRSKLRPIRSVQLEFRLKLRISRLNGNASRSCRLRKLHRLGETQPWRSPRRNAEANSSPNEKQRRGRRSHASFAKFCVCEASAFQACKARVK